jgi:hypothetical protein
MQPHPQPLRGGELRLKCRLQGSPPGRGEGVGRFMEGAIVIALSRLHSL